MGNIVSQKADDDDYDVLPHIPDDIISGNILTRLPVKSIVRFRCVCKSWQHLLTHDSDFVQSHLIIINSMDLLYNNNNGRIISRCLAEVTTKYFHPLKSRLLHLGGSVNGLVCVYHYWPKINYLGICNPATNQCKDIPIPSRAASVKLNWDDFGFAIGFDSINNDYKLVFITMFYDQPLVADVYLCNTCSWRQHSVVSSLVSLGDHHNWACPTIVQGCPYWYHCKVESFQNSRVVCFDVQHEVFRFLPGLHTVNVKRQSLVMVNLRDSLAIMVHDYPWYTPHSPSVLVYNFDELCGDWVKNYSIELFIVPGYMRLTHCFKNGDLLFCGGQYIDVFSVNPKSDKSDCLNGEWSSYDDASWKLSLSQCSHYLETLVSVKGMYQLRDCKPGPYVLIIEKSI